MPATVVPAPGFDSTRSSPPNVRYSQAQIQVHANGQVAAWRFNTGSESWEAPQRADFLGLSGIEFRTDG